MLDTILAGGQWLIESYRWHRWSLTRRTIATVNSKMRRRRLRSYSRRRSRTCAISPRILSPRRSEEHTSELQSLMRISYAVFCLKKKKNMKMKYHNDITYKDKT